jgi:integrase
VTTIVARAGGDGLPAYVTAEQARAVLDAAARTRDRLLVETLWRTGGRVPEVCRRRRSDLVPAAGALTLTNLKQRRRERRRELVYVAPSLVAARLASCADAGVPPTGHVVATVRDGEPRAMRRQGCWKLVTGPAAQAGVRVADTATGLERPATGLDFVGLQARGGGAPAPVWRAAGRGEPAARPRPDRQPHAFHPHARLTDAARRRYADRGSGCGPRRMVVLPALGGETTRTRLPKPSGAKRKRSGR